MCIRDRGTDHHGTVARVRAGLQAVGLGIPAGYPDYVLYKICLLYTSDAADERSSVDLGGRRIIKKKKKINDAR